jgi:5-oxoprolinase (ATP-hydrolysing) subunit A
VDINSDLGEGYGAWRMGDDDALLAVVTSANIACGFHAGDPQIMRRTAEVAAERGVAVGAHVSFPDRQGFGRRDLDIRPADVTDDVTYQIGALDAFARAAGSRVSYVKPHGALYNRMMVDEDLASAVVEALARFDGGLLLLALPGSAVGAVAERAGVPVVAEGFADRAYTADGKLVPRGQDGAVVSDIDEVARRAVRMAVSQTVTAIDGSEVALPVASLCVHGDTPDAVGIARGVRAALEEAGVPIGAFAGDG